MTNIHPTAVIAQGAVLGPGVRVGPFCVVGPHVILGAGCVLHSHVVIEGQTDLGEHCEVFPFAAVGTPPQDLKYDGEDSRLTIGSRTRIREHATLHPGTAGDRMETRVGTGCLLMVGSHVAHDCVLGNNVILANNATLGGHVTVGDGTIIGGLAAVHQFVRIGAGAIIGGMSGVEADVLPHARVKGERARLAGLNLIGLERQGADRAAVRSLQRLYDLIFAGEGPLEQRLTEVERRFAGDPMAAEVIAFARGRTRFPLCGPGRA
ncbi:MAG TPA: acyl-[acyl-carrier-protein]--UDP-N-acetylglucosamine O-acyltransferase [Rhodospirillaceae bacterium]|jgi:UDP-N-acetylglucosamine acyltransferase|nr:acyl-ACP--UDP-N-acetylglucosamine O-acyltransferase [Alphaproteobacteria bacterium]HBH26233.1 acyl-[acyl-carrier-protein]--UDP-N-acetylglucosamine O-acyltransferase [Rhodospirillaceae bacterium]